MLFYFKDQLSPLVSVSAGARPRPTQRRRITSMSETIAVVRRNRLISSGSAVETDIDNMTPRGSPGTFHPPLSAARDSIQIQQTSPVAGPSISKSRLPPPPRLATRLSYNIMPTTELIASSGKKLVRLFNFNLCEDYICRA